jgi:hypothetical protein
MIMFGIYEAEDGFVGAEQQILHGGTSPSDTRIGSVQFGLLSHRTHGFIVATISL